MGWGLSRGVARKLGVHRRMMPEALGNAIPVERKTPSREKPKLKPVMDFIDAILQADRKAPRKQRHTSHRIWCRLRAERPEVDIAECTVRALCEEAQTATGAAWP